MDILKLFGIGLVAVGLVSSLKEPLWAQTDTDFAVTHFAAVNGNPSSERVIVWLQGGPVIQPDEASVSDNGFAALAGDLDIFYVLPFQSQTLDPEKYDTDTITFKEAKTAAAASTRIVNETIKYFKKQGKQVDVISGSYGAFVAVDQLATYGNTADSYLIAVGRIDMPKEVWSEFSKGKPMGFIDGKEIVQITIEEAGMGTGTEKGDRNMMRLAAGLGHKRFSKLLNNTDMSNVTYLTARQDAQVGMLTPEEITFLESRGTTVIQVDGGHGDAFGTSEFRALMTEFFSEKLSNNSRY